MSTSMACKSQHAADVYEPVGQSSELSLVEMTEVEYLQHIIQSHIDAQVTETDSSGLSQLEESLYDEPERRLACSPQSPLVCRPEGTSAGPVDLQDIKMLLLSESNTTPASSAEVPGSVLSRVQCVVEERADERPLEGRPSPAARVCLEKRFLSVLCHSTNTSGIATHAQTEKWSKPDKMVKIQGTHPYEGRLFKSGVQSELIIPTELTVSFRADKGPESVMRAPLVIYTDTADQQTADTLKNEAVDKAAHPIKRVRTRPLSSSNIMQDSENWKPYAGMCGTKRCRTRPLMDRTQRKEVHNRKERDRRRRIRLCCDELNLLVPFCYADTDKATTLQWTTAFLKYIQEIHGDRLKQDFQSTFCGKTGLRLKPSCVSVAHLLEPYKNTTEPVDSSSHS
ncbi:transcription factor-like 5 protein [Sinocyclocheilus rhinocerous]|uniref:BHLH domain-containing protein n=1 Tax=Sinocyclocheilus rhinocerous TaxID=307959 RepID=A0A673HKP2_9TELE|nr:PREDICTED: transcription factor-like 5 protein [Sinocyclocheilus rhinocerous]